MHVLRLFVAVALTGIVWLSLPGSAQAAIKLADTNSFRLEGGIYLARLLNENYICATQNISGSFALIDIRNGNIEHIHSELGETRPFSPTLLSALGGNALIFDEAGSRLHLFAKDGNSQASCGFADPVFATPYGSPVDIIPAGLSFKAGFWLLTERGYVLSVSSDGGLKAALDLRKSCSAPGAFFSRIGKRADKLYLYAYSTAQIFEVTTSGTLSKTYDLLTVLGGDLRPSDALLLDDGRIITARGSRIFMITAGKAEEISSGMKTGSDQRFLDKLGDKVLIYTHSGDMAVGSLK
jgi:hypothetical protein